MNGESNHAEMGREIGIESVDRLVDHVEAICTHTVRQIALTNQARALSLRAEYALCLETRDCLKAKLRYEPPPGDIRNRRRAAAYHGVIASFLILAAIAFSVLAFEPFRLGAKGYLYCVGIGFLTPYLVEKIIDVWQVERTMKWIATGAGLAALASLMLLAVIRGDIFMHELAMMAAQPVVIDGASLIPQTPEDFYAKDAGLLRAVMVLLAFAMEVGAGIALHEVKRALAQSTEDWNALRNELHGAQQRLIALIHEIMTLENEAQIFAENFWRSFYHAMLTRTMKNAVTKLMLILIALCISPLHVRAAGKAAWVIAIDLSQSVGVTRGGHDAAFAHNVDAVSRLLSQVPAGTRITVIGITENSFLQPSILLTADISDDSGYFNERLTAARTAVVKVWQTRSKQLAPMAKHTDILGAFLLAADLFERTSTAKERRLIIFSDMRQSTSTLNLESATIPNYGRVRPNIPSEPDLKGVEVYVLGADETNGSTAYWQSLRRFWLEYFRDAGATVRSYSVLRDTSNFIE